MLCPQGKATVRKEVLDQLLYDYRYFSSVFKTSSNVYYMAYDFGFSPIRENAVEKALIINKQSYADKLGFEIWKGN